MNSKMLVPNINESQKSLIENHILDIASGDKESLVDLYNTTKASVYGFALSILKNVHEAEDVLQEVYIKVYENASLYQANGKPLAWMLKITKNLSLMKLRKNKNHMNVDDFREVLSDYKHITDKEDKILISTVFENISDEERNILILHSVSGFKHREIAKILEMPLATVLSKYNRAIKKIKKRMGEEILWRKKKLKND